MTTLASQITSLAIVYSIVYSDADQRKHQSSASLAFVRGFHRGPVNSPHKGTVTRKMFPFDDVIMTKANNGTSYLAFVLVFHFLFIRTSCWIERTVKLPVIWSAMGCHCNEEGGVMSIMNTFMLSHNVYTHLLSIQENAELYTVYVLNKSKSENK